MARVPPTRSRRAKARPFPLFQQMTIVGVGLIGGSLGMTCKQQGLVKTIVGAGRRVKNLKRAVELKAIDRYVTDLAEAAAGSDLLVLATPVDTFEAVLRTCAENRGLAGQLPAMLHTIANEIQRVRNSGEGLVDPRQASAIVRQLWTGEPGPN